MMVVCELVRIDDGNMRLQPSASASKLQAQAPSAQALKFYPTEIDGIKSLPQDHSLGLMDGSK